MRDTSYFSKTHNWRLKDLMTSLTCSLHDSLLSNSTPNTLDLLEYSIWFPPHLIGGNGPTKAFFCNIITSVFPVCKVSL